MTNKPNIEVNLQKKKINFSVLKYTSQTAIIFNLIKA